MTLQELKAKATASELTLIEATEKLLKEVLTKEIKQSLFAFLRRNPPPSSDFNSFRPGEGVQKWVEQCVRELEQ